MLQRDVNVALTAAPSPTIAICPSEICPAHPVRTTSEMPMMAKAISAVPLMTYPTGRMRGTRSTASTAVATSVQRTVLTTGSARTAAGSGRTSSAPRQLLVKSLSRRALLVGWTRSTMKIAAAMIG